MALSINASAAPFAGSVFKQVRVVRPSLLANHIRRRQALQSCAQFHGTSRRQVVKQYPLADIGEGITECQIIQWRVQVGARVNEFDPLCEVASDKATADIPSRYSGVIKKLYYEADELAIVGRPLVDIDVDEGAAEEIAKMQDETAQSSPDEVKPEPEPEQPKAKDRSPMPETPSKSHAQTLATPATRHLSKQLNVDITDVTGTGKDGRVTKEDIQRFVADRDTASTPSNAAPARVSISTGDKQIPLRGIQAQMFKTMTKSLSIPHFLYTDSVDMTGISSLRSRLNNVPAQSSTKVKLSPLPFIVKAVSLAFLQYPALNAHLDMANADKPILTHRASHNIGVAVDTPGGLVVPVVRNVQQLSVLDIATEISRLASLARENKLSPSDLSGATFSISNIGSIGGGAVAPVIVSPQVAILGVGRAKTVPAFAEDGVSLIKRQEAVFSWSADHRVCDGAMVARAGDLVRWYIENVEQMVVRMR